jgi:hypothetical protein
VQGHKFLVSNAGRCDLLSIFNIDQVLHRLVRSLNCMEARILLRPEEYIFATPMLDDAVPGFGHS